MSLTVYKDIYSKNHQKIGDILSELGQLYLDLNDIENAIDYFEQSLEIKKMNSIENSQ